MTKTRFPVFLGCLILLTACTPAIGSSPETDTADARPTSASPSEWVGTPSPDTSPQGRTIVVTSTSDSGPGSLRNALQDAQDHDAIIFDRAVFPPDAPATIYLTSDELPPIRANNLILDASDAGVALDGSGLSDGWATGLQIASAEGNKIMGFQISHFPGAGIKISGVSKYNVIGGDRSVGAGPYGQGNFISNNVIGIQLSTEGATDNIITGNLIGIDTEGSKGLGNALAEISMADGAHDNTVRSDNLIASYKEEGLQEQLASIIFHNGVILTMEDTSPASAIALKDERILDVGDDETMLSYAGAETKRIDLQGHTLMPGFVDSHSHIFNNPWRDDLEGAQTYLLSNGITTTAELFVEEPLILDLQQLDQKGKLRMRVSLYLVHVDNCGGVRGAWYLPDYPVSREPGAMLQIPGIKMFNDGGYCNATAVSYEYGGGFGRGDLYFEAEELAEMIVEAQQQGYQVAIHGLGDRAIDAILDAIELALDGGSNIYRHRIEHNAIVRDEMLPRYSEVDPIGTILGHFPSCVSVGDPNEYQFSTPEEFRHRDGRWRDLLDVNPGVHFAWHSDTPWLSDPIPMLHLQGFVTRRQLQEDGTFCEPANWAADDLLTVDEALPMMTLEAAYALLREDEIGSLKAGKLADLIVLSENPLEVNPDAIQDIQVLMTMVGGEVEHCLQEHAALCP
jgi:predicted amidohydrolase YtcJ